jgi:hypothetical protein
MTVIAGFTPLVFLSRIARAKSSTISRVLSVVIGGTRLKLIVFMELQPAIRTAEPSIWGA